MVSTMQEKTDALLQKVAEGTRQVFQSDNYKNYLNTMSKFHSYSARNNLLIFMQCPHASYVAGFKAWKTNFNRYVKKGEHGISIIGFSKKKITKLQPKLNEHGQQMTDAAGKTIMEKVTVEIPNFVPVNVFDVSQTDGEPLPKLTMELSNTVDNYDTLFSALSQVSPFPIHIEHIEGGSKGYSNPIEHKIGIKSGMSQAQTVKTAIHEITHADLHGPDKPGSPSRTEKEVVAESVAYVVCSHYGIDTSDYSFPYLASWSSSKELGELQNNLETIRKQSCELIDRIDARLQELVQEKTPKKSPMKDRLKDAQHKAAESPKKPDKQQIAELAR